MGSCGSGIFFNPTFIINFFDEKGKKKFDFMKKDDFSILSETDHYLEWLGENPGQSIRFEIEQNLRRQVPTAKIKWLQLLGKPEFLTGGRPVFNDPDKIIMTRAALAVSFQMQVDSDVGEEILNGVFSWAATELDKNRNDRVFLDLNMEMAEAAMLLKMRIYEVEEMDEGITEKPKPWWKIW